jgi:hypothetical protein
MAETSMNFDLENVQPFLSRLDDAPDLYFASESAALVDAIDGQLQQFADELGL